MHKEHHVPHESKCVAQHQGLQLAVVRASPMRPRQERPADLYLAPDSVVTMKPRRPNDVLGAPVQREQSAPGGQVLGKEVAKHVLSMPIRIRMLRPDQWVSGYGIKIRKVGFTERSQFDKVAE
jgi:hypothetical protein